MELNYLQQINCLGYLLVAFHVETTTPVKVSMSVRQTLRRNVKKEGFVPFMHQWHIKPIFADYESSVTQAVLEDKQYTLPVSMSFLYISRDDFIKGSTIELTAKDLHNDPKFKHGTSYAASRN